MRAAVLTCEYGGMGGNVTLGRLVCDHLNADPIVVGDCTDRPVYRERRLDKFKPIWGDRLKVVIGNEEIVNVCNSYDIIFVTNLRPWGKKKIDEMYATFDRITAKKVMMCLGTAEWRMKNTRPSLQYPGWDCWWSARPLTRDFFVNNGTVPGSIPYIVGCNPYTMTDGQTTGGERDKVISNTRFACVKRSADTVDAHARLLDAGIQTEAWGYNPTEGCTHFLGKIKCVPERFADWNRLKAAGILKGEYSRDDVDKIFARARFSIDHTYSRNDGTLWGDGGMQYCQAESFDRGVVPVVNRKFYIGDEWDSILYRVDHPSETVELYKNWDPHRHWEMLERGREYVRKFLTYERFIASIDEVVTRILPARAGNFLTTSPA